jgi:hypothetical protein
MLVGRVSVVLKRARQNQRMSVQQAAVAATQECNQLFGPTLQPQDDLPGSRSPALQFQVQAEDGPQARTAQMQLPHFLCETPMFMPVGTKGAGLAHVHWHVDASAQHQLVPRTSVPVLPTFDGPS